jgi:hypothetical protein
MTKLIMVAAVLGFAACATDALPPGAVCKVTADCETTNNLMCLEVAQFSGTTCTVVGHACSIVCTDDTSCAVLGANFKCFAGCGAQKTCEMVAQ